MLQCSMARIINIWKAIASIFCCIATNISFYPIQGCWRFKKQAPVLAPRQASDITGKITEKEEQE
jgi:hypothetical protein